jgi:hypothetical protein
VWLCEVKKRRKEGFIMKKIALVLAVLLFTAPAMAALSVSCSESAGTVTVAYNAGGGTLPRAFALDVSLSGGATINSGPSSINSEFYIYPGSISISGGSVTGWGTPVAAGGVGNSTMTVELGSLYASNDTDHLTAPPNAANLLSFGVSGTTTITITENSARGGVVMEDGSANGLGSPVCTCSTGPGDCLKSSDPGYAKWSTTYGKPSCWCYKKQCNGDADGVSTFFKPVMLSDLNTLKASYNKSEALAVASSYGAIPGICADFDHVQTFFKPVMLSDLNILKSYYNLGEALVPQCASTHINYWTN